MENLTILEEIIADSARICRKTADEPYCVIGDKAFTGNQMAEEIENKTEIGVKIIKGLFRLTLDLVQRGKKTLEI